MRVKRIRQIQEDVDFFVVYCTQQMSLACGTCCVLCAADEGVAAPRAGPVRSHAHDWHQPVCLAQRVGAGDEARDLDLLRP